MRAEEKARFKAALIKIERIKQPSEIQCNSKADEQALTNSIRQNGIIVPLIVRRCGWPSRSYELVSGRRRLAAAKKAGLKRVPAVVVEGGEELALRCRILSDSHRAEAGGYELATALEKLALQRGESYEKLAGTLGMSEEEMASALSALKLEADEERVCEAAELGERDKRYILSLPRSERNRLFYGLLADSRELGRRAKILRERLQGWHSGSHRRTIAFNDVRIFFNTIDRALDVMKEAGIDAVSERQDLDDYVEYRIRIPASEAFERREPKGNSLR